MRPLLLCSVIAFFTSSVQAQIPTESQYLWLKADAGITEDSVQKTSVWMDQSGNGHHAKQSSPIKRPQKDQANGIDYLLFFQSTMQIDSVDLRHTDKITAFIVYKTLSETNSPVMELSTDYNSETDGFILWKGMGKQTLAVQGNEGYSHYTSVFTTDSFKITTCILNKSLTSGEAKIRLNGADVMLESLNASNQANQDNNNTDSFGNHSFFIGARAGASFFMDGGIAEIILYDDSLAMDSMVQIESYLLNKYSVRNASVRNLSHPNIAIAPNPVQNSFKVYYNEEAANQPVAELYTLSGQHLKSIQPNPSGEYDVTDIPAGVYTIHLSTESNHYLQKIIKL